MKTVPVHIASATSPSTARARRREPDWTGALPTDVVRRGTHRLSVAALVLAGIGMMATILQLGSDDLFSRVDEPFRRPIGIPVAACLGAIVFLYVFRYSKLQLRWKVLLGFVFLVLVSFVWGMYRHWIPYSPSEIPRGLGGPLTWIVLFASLMPAAPRKIAVATCIAAVMDPLALLATVTLLGNPVPGVRVVLVQCMPMLGAPLLAVVVSKVLYDLGRRLQDASELGSYRLIRRIGAGGMGEVWEARHQLLARPSAVKLIRADGLEGLDSHMAQSVLRRFEREARATSVLESPHTIEVYDFGVADDCTLYYVMELLDGMDLQQLVTKFGPLPQERVIHVLLQACHSLRDAHDNGMVHRDIKPSNIFLARKGRDVDFVKVLDFGIVQLRVDSAVEAAEGGAPAIAGTPAYMAPEIITEDGVIDHRVDIYALGCVAYWLVTAKVPFRGTKTQVLNAHVGVSPVPPSSVGLAEVSPAFEDVILRCLEKSPDRRFQTMQDLLDALAACREVAAWTQADASTWWAAHMKTRTRSWPPEGIQPTTSTTEDVPATVRARKAVGD